MALQFITENTGILKNAVFCFTGKSPKPRKEMVAIANKAGATVTQSVINMTTILVITDANSMSTKAKKAYALGIDLISPEQFFEMCGSVTASNSGSKISQVHIKKPKPATKPTEKRKHSSVRRIEL